MLPLGLRDYEVGVHPKGSLALKPRLKEIPGLLWEVSYSLEERFGLGGVQGSGLMFDII